MNIFMTFNRVAKSENLPINPSSPQKKQKDALGCYWPGHNCLTTFPCHPPPSPHVAKAPGEGAVPPWRVSSSVALGLPAFSWKDASFSASYHSRVLASAAIFISGSNYGEIQPFISSGKTQKLGGVEGDMNPRMTLGNSSSAPDGWCSAPTRWGRLDRPASEEKAQTAAAFTTNLAHGSQNNAGATEAGCLSAQQSLPAQMGTFSVDLLITGDGFLVNEKGMGSFSYKHIPQESAVFFRN